jgi:Ca2+-binding EF-hand superfamily protein
MTIDIEQILKDLDADGSGRIHFDEFRKLLTSSGGTR